MSDTSTGFGIDRILRHLPHRYPLLMVDRIDAVTLGKRIRGRKNVCANDPSLAGHFPGHPIMPGVLIIEALAQLSCVLVCETTGRQPDDGRLHYLAGVDGARFKRPVRPGDVLLLESEVLSMRRNLTKLQCTARVEEELACTATLICVEGEAAS